MKITLYGLAGTGTTTLAKALAQKLNLEFKSTGNMFRELAEEHKMSIYEFDKAAQKNLKYDKELDQKVKLFAEQNDDFIIESRLAWYFIPDSFKIKLVCDEDMSYSRVAKREGLTFEEAKEKTIERAQTIEERYSQCYPEITFPPQDEEFDLVLDSTYTQVEDLVEKIVSLLDKESR